MAKSGSSKKGPWIDASIFEWSLKRDTASEARPSSTAVKNWQNWSSTDWTFIEKKVSVFFSFFQYILKNESSFLLAASLPSLSCVLHPPIASFSCPTWPSAASWISKQCPSPSHAASLNRAEPADCLHGWQAPVVQQGRIHCQRCFCHWMCRGKCIGKDHSGRVRRRKLTFLLGNDRW